MAFMREIQHSSSASDKRQFRWLELRRNKRREPTTEYRITRKGKIIPCGPCIPWLASAVASSYSRRFALMGGLASDCHSRPLIHSDHDFLIPQSSEQLGHGFHLTGQNQIRRDFTQGLQNKPAKMRAWMRKSQRRRRANFGTEGNEVQVQRAWFIQDFFGRAAKFL